MKGWAVIDGKMYRFTDEGVMLRGWINVNNNMYFMDDNGVMQTGWLTIDGETYYLAENGIELASFGEYKMKEERMIAYSAFCSAREKLFISYIF